MNIVVVSQSPNSQFKVPEGLSQIKKNQIPIPIFWNWADTIFALKFHPIQSQSL